MKNTLVDKAIMIYNDLEKRFYISDYQSQVFDLIYTLLKNGYSPLLIEDIIAMGFLAR